MRDDTHTPFEQINRGFTATFQNGRLSVGLVVPIAQYGQRPVPDRRNSLGSRRSGCATYPSMSRALGMRGSFSIPLPILGIWPQKPPISLWASQVSSCPFATPHMWQRPPRQLTFCRGGD